MAITEQIGDISWQLVSLIAILVIGLLVTIWIMFVKRDRSARPTRNPLVTTLFVVGMILLIVITLDVLVFTDTEFTKKYGWIILILTAVVVIYQQYKWYKKINPLPYKKLRQKAFVWAKEATNERVYEVGKFYGYPMDAYKHIQRTMNDPTSKISIFLLMTEKATGVLLGLNAFDAYESFIKINPSIELINKMFGKEIADQYDELRYEIRQGLPPEQLKPGSKQPEEEQNEG